MTSPATMPKYVDKARLCHELTISDATADEWVKKEIIPAPIKRGGKLMWKWETVEARIDDPGEPVAASETDDVRRITDATKRAIS